MSSTAHELYQLREAATSIRDERSQYTEAMLEKDGKINPYILWISFVIGVVSFCVGVNVAAPFSFVLLSVGVAGLAVFVTKLAKSMLSGHSASLHYNSLSSMEDQALEAYFGALEKEAEAHGIDAGSLQPREGDGQDGDGPVSSFFATRNGTAVALEAVVRGEEVILLANGQPLAGATI